MHGKRESESGLSVSKRERRAKEGAARSVDREPGRESSFTRATSRSMSLVAGTASRPTGLSLVVGDGGWQSRESTRTQAKHRNFGPYGWGEGVVPDGSGVAYTSGFDDFLQFTVTSRTEMPNVEFCEGFCLRTRARASRSYNVWYVD
ncbi:hypothetical protein C8Q76DRAFT_335535 [Earliella scabrosa]|nr:hypothetical protein C8Q76DRAFT_335535 [Earliella scabrosa]